MGFFHAWTRHEAASKQQGRLQGVDLAGLRPAGAARAEFRVRTVTEPYPVDGHLPWASESDTRAGHGRGQGILERKVEAPCI
jgi:hypothetical protein